MRPQNDSHSQTQNEHVLVKEEYWACFVIPVLFWLFASLTMTMGYYGSKLLVLGPNYSHLMKANPLFVSHIEVNDHKKGSILYGFSVHPVLSSQSLWKENYTKVFEPDSHQEYVMWLNKGSKLRLTCSVESTNFYSIIMTVSQGYSKRKNWFRKRTAWQAIDAWRELQSQIGSLEYEVKQDGKYLVAVSNLNQQAVGIDLQVEVNATIYGTESADIVCLLGAHSCKIALPLVEKRYVLLTTPAMENRTSTWEVELLYGARWISYYAILACILVSVAAFLKAINWTSQSLSVQGQSLPQDVLVDDNLRNSLLSMKDGVMDALHGANPEEEGIIVQSGDDVCNTKLCAICLDAPQMVFFIPCGHSATCLACAKRIRHHEMGCCPICRVKIDKIGKVFTA